MNWETASDWDSRQEGNGVHDAQPTGTNFAPSDVVEKGVPIDWTTEPDIPQPEFVYPLQESSGTSTAYDISGNGRDGTHNGPTLGNTGGPLQQGYASYDGSNDWTDISDTWTSNISDSITVLIFLDVPGTVDELYMAFAMNTSSGDNVVHLSISDGSAGSEGTLAIFNPSDAFSLKGNTDLRNRGWSMAGWKVSGSERSLYVDGSVDETGTQKSIIPFANDDVASLGQEYDGGTSSSDTSNHYEGNMALAMGWSSALTDSQVAEIWEWFV